MVVGAKYIIVYWLVSPVLGCIEVKVMTSIVSCIHGNHADQMVNMDNKDNKDNIQYSYHS